MERNQLKAWVTQFKQLLTPGTVDALAVLGIASTSPPDDSMAPGCEPGVRVSYPVAGHSGHRRQREYDARIQSAPSLGFGH